MKQKELLEKLQAAGLVFALLGFRLVIKSDTLNKASQEILALLSSRWEEVRDTFSRAMNKSWSGKGSISTKNTIEDKGKKLPGYAARLCRTI